MLLFINMYVYIIDGELVWWIDMQCVRPYFKLSYISMLFFWINFVYITYCHDQLCRDWISPFKIVVPQSLLSNVCKTTV